MEWLPLSGGAEADKEVYLIRFGPGSRSHPHIHQGSEEFLVLDGELTDHDGMVFQTGDFVRFEPGSEHWSFSEKGCTLLVILAGGTNRPVPDNWVKSGPISDHITSLLLILQYLAATSPKTPHNRLLPANFPYKNWFKVGL